MTLHMSLHINKTGQIRYRPLLDYRLLTRLQWKARIEEMRRQSNTLPDFWECGLLTNNQPVQLALSLACDYTFHMAWNQKQLLSRWYDVTIVSYLKAQGLAEDHWNQLCKNFTE